MAAVLARLCVLLCLQGKVFSKQLQLDDFATDLPLAYQEGRGLLGGFTIVSSSSSSSMTASQMQR